MKSLGMVKQRGDKVNSLEDYDLTELEGEFLMMPEDRFYEAVLWIREIKSNNLGYSASGILYQLSNDEVTPYYMTNDAYHSMLNKMDFLENNKHVEFYKRSIIDMTFNQE